MATATRTRPSGWSTSRSPVVRPLRPLLTLVPEVPAVTDPADLPTLPASVMPRRSGVELLDAASRGVTEAEVAGSDADRYALAHLSALRAAAAVLALRARPSRSARRGGRPTDVWALLAEVSPPLAEWAVFFAAGAGKRAAAEAGVPHAVTRREADDLVRDAAAFLQVVRSMLGQSHQATIPTSA